MEELINTGQSDVVGRLAFKYMEMCKVDSSSDFESDTNPRWSDVSSKGCESSAPETRDAPNTLRRNYQQCPDPYDGSSEDSSDDGGVRKGSRPRGQRSSTAPPWAPARRAGMRPDVQMRSSSDSEPDMRDQDCGSGSLSDSGFNTRSGLSSPAPDTLPPGSPDSPALLTAFPKRKFFPPAGELEDGMRRKRQCVTDMEV